MKNTTLGSSLGGWIEGFGGEPVDGWEEQKPGEAEGVKLAPSWRYFIIVIMMMCDLYKICYKSFYKQIWPNPLLFINLKKQMLFYMNASLWEGGILFDIIAIIIVITKFVIGKFKMVSERGWQI